MTTEQHVDLNEVLDRIMSDTADAIMELEPLVGNPDENNDDPVARALNDLHVILDRLQVVKHFVNTFMTMKTR